MKENRRWPRIPVAVSCLLTTEILPPWWIRVGLAGVTENVSRRGACVRLTAPFGHLHPGQEGTLRLSHPMYQAGLDIHVQIVWVRGRQVGLQFVRVCRKPPARVTPEQRQRAVEGYGVGKLLLGSMPPSAVPSAASPTGAVPPAASPTGATTPGAVPTATRLPGGDRG